MSELVTGEAVVLELRLARPATRAIALFVDLVLELVAFALLLLPVAAVTGDGASESLVAGLVIACLVLTFVGYTTAMETLTRGKTVGKYALGLRVVRDDGGPVRFRQAFVRALCGVFVDFFTTMGCVGFLTAMLNARGKRIGDILAGTVVLRERAPRTHDPHLEVPAGLAAWAAQAELSRVPDNLALSARSYLGRYHDLDPAAREALGNRLAGAVAGYVSPTPPPGVLAWAYLSAVLAERRRREFDRRQAAAPSGQQPVGAQAASIPAGSLAWLPRPQQRPPEPQPAQSPAAQPAQSEAAPEPPAPPQDPPPTTGFAPPR